MSSNPHVSQQPATKPNHSSAASLTATKRQYSGYMSDVNARLKYLTDHVFPESPYYITVPTTSPFRLGNRYVSNWAVGRDTVFAPEEEHLQYMTFLSHQNEDTLLVAVGGWADAKGNIMREEESNNNAKPASAPAQNGGQKKKISLSDYKKKAQQGPTSKPPSTPSSVEDKKSVSPHKGIYDQTPMPPAQEANKHRRPELPHRENGLHGPTNQQKARERINRPVDTSNAQNDAINPSKRKLSGHKATESTPQKKLRLSIDQDLESDISTEPEKKKRQRPAVPELLSPTLPSSAVRPKIPKLLSPTLPDNLEEELARFPGESSSSEHQSTKKKSSSSGSLLDSAAAKPKAADIKRPHSSSTSIPSSGKDISLKSLPTANSTTTLKSRDKELKTPAATTTSKPSPPVSSRSASTAAKAPITSSQPKPVSSRPGTTTSSKSRLIVKLKYGRQNRKLVEGLLKFSGKKKAPAEQAAVKTKPGSASNNPSKEMTTPTTQLGKQHRPQSSGHKRSEPTDANDAQQPSSLKRPRSSTTTSDRPQTPVIQVTKPSPASLKKPFLTPTRDIKGVAMRRVGSGDSETKTPAGISPPSVPGSAERGGKSSLQSTTDGPSEWRAWREEYQKFAALGRELKHTARRYTGNNGDGDSASGGTADEKLAAATEVESLLCFIVAFTADGRSHALSRQPSDSASWRSILPYWKAVTHGSAARYPHLQGLCFLLGAISHETIHALDLERLAITALPSEHSPAPTPGSDGNTVTSDESKRQKREFADLKSRLPETYREASRLWLAGSCGLSDDVLARQYPETWSRRSKNFAARGTEKLRLGRYAGEYFLPLGRATLPLEVVRFGLAFLEEWCAKEGVKWRGKLTL